MCADASRDRVARQRERQHTNSSCKRLRHAKRQTSENIALLVCPLYVFAPNIELQTSITRNLAFGAIKLEVERARRKRTFALASSSNLYLRLRAQPKM